MKKTIKVLALLAAAIAVNSLAVNGQAWNLAGNNNMTNTSKIGGTSATTAQNFPLRFYTYNAQRMHINANVAGRVGYVGIGTTAPATRLHVNGVVTATGGTSTNWNLAYTRVPAGVTSFIPRWSGTAYVAGTIYDNGTNVGIGFNAPAYPLEVAGRMRLRSSPGNTAGAWLNNDNNSATNAFIGMASNNLVGFWGNLGVGWGLAMNCTNGNVGIGTLSPVYRLDVCGTIRSTEVRVNTGWCDYVFADEYELAPLSEVEAFIKENKHLPEVTPGNIIEAEGLEVGKVSSQMIKKIEELTLYVIEQEKQIKNLQAQLNSLVAKGGK